VGLALPSLADVEVLVLGLWRATQRNADQNMRCFSGRLSLLARLWKLALPEARVTGTRPAAAAKE
jgi:hypothetical protein